MSRFSRPLTIGLLTALLPFLSVHAATVQSLRLEVPPGRDSVAIHRLIRSDEGLPLSDAMVHRHVEVLGELGWVSSVNVGITALDDETFEVRYQLQPRDQVQEIRLEGNRLLGAGDLLARIRSRVGTAFDLRQALEDAESITTAYDEHDLPFSGVLSQRGVHFQGGVLTFRITEARLEALGKRPGDRPLTSSLLADLLAERSVRDQLDLEQLEIDVDPDSGVLQLQ